MGRKPRDFNEFLHELDSESFDDEMPLFDEADLASLRPFGLTGQSRDTPATPRRKPRSR